MIKNIIFDVGKVLVAFSWERVLHSLGFAGAEFEAVADATVRSELWNEYDRSRISDEELLAGFIAHAPEWEPQIRRFWAHVGDTISCYPYAHDWVQGWRDKGYGCYILSNYARRTYEMTREQLSFEKRMNGALYSFQVQQVKPEPEIYQTLLSRFQLLAEECVFLDDNEKNVIAARQLGIQAILFTTREAADEALAALGVK